MIRFSTICREKNPTIKTIFKKYIDVLIYTLVSVKCRTFCITIQCNGEKTTQLEFPPVYVGIRENDRLIWG